MANLDILHFEQLKLEIQSKYLERHTPSDENISNWKGIDIIYFQEDLRKYAKGNISEKSFYTYFKNSPVNKIPRIDILNLLSVYAGYASWFDFKKNHLFAGEILQEIDEFSDEDEQELEKEIEQLPESKVASPLEENVENQEEEKPILQKNNTDNEFITEKNDDFLVLKKTPKKAILQKQFLWILVALFVGGLLTLIATKSIFVSKEFTYTFIDADRNSKIYNELDVKILKDNESPILFKVKPNSPFIYRNPETKLLKMVVSSPYYKTDTILRNLETAPENENIELKPNDYAIMLYYYSNAIQEDIKRKRERLNMLISENALIYQIYDNDKYGVETLDKNRYINLVTTPTTSLKNMEVIDTQMNKGKIILIKFRIVNNETNL